MKDTEIIKALKCCNTAKTELHCDVCPFYSCEKCTISMLDEAVNLIERQKAEIERLQKAECSFAEAGGKLVVQYKQAKDQICRLQADKDSLIRNYANFQKELLKEFAEQVKTAFYAEFDELIPSIMADKIDEIYKEMVGEKCNETD